MWFIIFPPHCQQNYWSMLSVLWSRGCVCGWVSMCPQLHCSQFGTGAIFDKSWWFSKAKQLATSYEKHPCLCSEMRAHTHCYCEVYERPPGVSECALRARRMQSAVRCLSINAGETCRWDNAVQTQAKDWWLDTFHLEEVHPIRGSIKRRMYGNQPSACVSGLHHQSR